MKRSPCIYLFSAEDLDNEEVIIAVENSPTFKRTRGEVKSISGLSGQQRVSESASSSPSSPVQSTISFNQE